jgi:ATP-dependent helicase/nuclease subunit B
LPVILERLMASVAVRHPTASIRDLRLGLIEARLQHADLVISAVSTKASGRRFRRPIPGWRHGFAPSLACLRWSGGSASPRMISPPRSAPAGAGDPCPPRRPAPAIASRFWLRLEAMTGGVARSPLIRKWARDLDRPGAYRSAQRPAPSPTNVRGPFR